MSRDPLGYVDGMSLYRGYFGVRGVDPSGKRMLQDRGRRPVGSEAIGYDDKGRPIVKIHSDEGGGYYRAGLSPGDCFVWDPESKTRIRIECPPGRVSPGGARRGKVCAITLLDHGPLSRDDWTGEAMEIAPGNWKKDIASRQQIIDFLKGRNCCTLYIIGHQGGDISEEFGGPNMGGVTSYPDAKDSEKPVIILPTRDYEGISPNNTFESELRHILNCDEGCVINLFACGSHSIENWLTRQKIADRTGCTVCGATDTTYPGEKTFVDPPVISGLPDRSPELGQPKQWIPRCNDPIADRKK